MGSTPDNIKKKGIGSQLNSTASSGHNSGSDDEQQPLIDDRKQKRMLSNRESARRSRMKKQQHLDDLQAQVARLRADNNALFNNFNIASRYYLQIEDENLILRSQAMELTRKLQSLQIVIQQAAALNGPVLSSVYADSGFVDAISMGALEGKKFSWPSVCQSLAAAEILQ